MILSLKRSLNLKHGCLKNYRPMSKLHLIYELLRLVVARVEEEHMQDSDVNHSNVWDHYRKHCWEYAIKDGWLLFPGQSSTFVFNAGERFTQTQERTHICWMFYLHTHTHTHTHVRTHTHMCVCVCVCLGEMFAHTHTHTHTHIHARAYVCVWL